MPRLGRAKAGPNAFAFPPYASHPLWDLDIGIWDFCLPRCSREILSPVMRNGDGNPRLQKKLAQYDFAQTARWAPGLAVGGMRICLLKRKKREPEEQAIRGADGGQCCGDFDDFETDTG